MSRLWVVKVVLTAVLLGAAVGVFVAVSDTGTLRLAIVAVLALGAALFPIVFWRTRSQLDETDRLVRMGFWFLQVATMLGILATYLGLPPEVRLPLVLVAALTTTAGLALQVYRTGKRH